MAIYTIIRVYEMPADDLQQATDRMSELRILFTMYRSTTNHSPAIVENARKIWRENILNVKIPHSTIFARSYDEKTPVYKLEPQHPGSIAYDVLADWLITYNNENA